MYVYVGCEVLNGWGGIAIGKVKNEDHRNTRNEQQTDRRKKKEKTKN